MMQQNKLIVLMWLLRILIGILVVAVVGLTCDGRLAMTRWDGETTTVLVDFITSKPFYSPRKAAVN
jgi:hypothetical protein